MKSTGCEWCNDLRNVHPASYLGGGDKKFQEWIKPLRDAKKFIYLGDSESFSVIEECPKCGKVFDEEDYDSYM